YEESFPPLVGAKARAPDRVEILAQDSDCARAFRKEKSERTPHHVIRDVTELRIKLLTMVTDHSVNGKCARAIISTARDLEAEVNRAKDDSIDSLRMVALEARLHRLKGVSPVRINEFASELNLNSFKKGVNIQLDGATTEAEGVAPLSSEDKVSRSASGLRDSDFLVGYKSGTTDKQTSNIEAKPGHEYQVFDTLPSQDLNAGSFSILEVLEMDNVEESSDEAGEDVCKVEEAGKDEVSSSSGDESDDGSSNGGSEDLETEAEEDEVAPFTKDGKKKSQGVASDQVRNSDSVPALNQDLCSELYPACDCNMDVDLKRNFGSAFKDFQTGESCGESNYAPQVFDKGLAVVI
ncbi:hypothetical protein U1Q18_003400, partial [Sarracenia purpurea var. burkii]